MYVEIQQEGRKLFSALSFFASRRYAQEISDLDVSSPRFWGMGLYQKGN
jgi:hypothetical protein